MAAAGKSQPSPGTILSVSAAPAAAQSEVKDSGVNTLNRLKEPAVPSYPLAGSPSHEKSIKARIQDWKIEQNFSRLFNRKITNPNDSAHVQRVMDFFNNIKLKDTKAGNVGDGHKDFYINMKVLSDAMKKLPPEDTETRNRLGMRMLGYLYKYSVPHPVDPAHPVNPMQTTQDLYYRDPKPNRPAIRNGFTDYIADKLKMENSKLSLVNVARAQERLKQECILPSNPDFFSWKDGGRLDEIDEASHTGFQEKFPNISEVMELIEKEGKKNIYLDIGEAVRLNWEHVQNPYDITLLFKTLESFVHDVFQYGLSQHLGEKYADIANSTERRAKIQEEMQRAMQKVRARIVVGTVFKMGNQVLIYNGRIADPDQEIPGEKKSTLRPWSRTVPFWFLEAGEMEWDRSPLNRAGFFPTPQAVMENWLLANEDVSSVLEKMHVEDVGGAISFPPASGQLIAFKDFSHFLEHDIVKSFGALSGETATYLRILSEIIGKRLHSFAHGVADKAYREAGLQDFLQFSMNRLLFLMQRALDKKAIFPVFLHYVERIQEEITNIRMMATLATKQDVQRVLEDTPLSRKLAGAGIKSSFFFENCGMSCVEALFHAWETSLSDHRDKSGIHQPPVIVIFQYTYPEIQAIAKLGERYPVITVNEYNPSCVEDLKKKLEEEFGGRKIGLIFAQFHSSCSSGNQPPVYKKADITGNIEKMYAEDMLSEHLTVALDSTIGLIADPHIEEFCDHHSERMSDGALNTAVFRSAQKWDMGGMGNLAGGLIGVYNNGRAFQGFDEAMARHDETAASSRFDIHGVLHFLEHASEELDQYRRAIMKTANRMMDPQDEIGFPESMFIGAEEASPLSVPHSEDSGLTFVKIFLQIENMNILKGNEYGDLLIQHLVRHATRHPDTFPMMHRESFGFHQTTLSSATVKDIIRISPGLEPDDILKNYRDYLVLLNDVLRDGKKRFPGQGDAIMRAVLEHGDSLVALVGQRGDEGSGIEEKIEEAWRDIEARLPRREATA